MKRKQEGEKKLASGVSPVMNMNIVNNHHQSHPFEPFSGQTENIWEKNFECEIIYNTQANKYVFKLCI